MPRPHEPRELICTRRLEAQAARQGWRLVAGCDEAGRGALLGPLYAAAVILDPVRPIPGLDDSKKLSPQERASLAAEIHKYAIAFQVVALEAAEVDADRKSTRLNSSHRTISYAVFCLKKKNKQ